MSAQADRAQDSHRELYRETITSAAESLALHVTLLEQHVDLYVRHQDWESSVVRVQTQLSECQARGEQTESLLEEACAKHAKLRSTTKTTYWYVIDYSVNRGYGYGISKLPMVEQILDSRVHLRHTCRILSFS